MKPVIHLLPLLWRRCRRFRFRFRFCSWSWRHRRRVPVVDLGQCFGGWFFWLPWRLVNLRDALPCLEVVFFVPLGLQPRVLGEVHGWAEFISHLRRWGRQISHQGLLYFLIQIPRRGATSHVCLYHRRWGLRG